MIQVFVALALLSAKSELLFLVVLFFLILAFSFFHTPYAWGGLFLALVGFVLRRKVREAEGGGEIRVDKAKVFVARLHGPATVLMILCGASIAFVDIWKNGANAYTQGKESASVVVHNVSGKAAQTVDVISREPYRRTIQVRLGEYRRALELLHKESNGKMTALIGKLIEIIDSIDSEDTLRKAQQDTELTAVEALRAEREGLGANREPYNQLSSIAIRILLEIEATDAKNGLKKN
jgi:hypothetical protein